MTLLESFFDAMVRLDGDTLVMQVGQKPYLVRAASTYRGPVEWGQVELSTKPLTLDAAMVMLAEILPEHEQRALSEIGAVEHEFTPPGSNAERLTVVAARGGDDIWIEIRRKSLAQPVDVGDTTDEALYVPPAYVEPSIEPPIESSIEEPIEESIEPSDDIDEPVYVAAEADDSAVGAVVAAEPEPAAESEPAAEPVPEPVSAPAPEPARERLNVVVPMSRPPSKPVPPPPAPPVASAPVRLRVEQLLSAAIDIGASSLFIVAGERPMVRINRDVRPLNADPLGATDIEQFVKRRRKTPTGTNGAVESVSWCADLRDIGRVECIAVEDHRGPAMTIHLVQPGLNSADHLGLSEDVQALSDAPDGLVLIVSPRAGGKTTLAHAFVDVINRTRCDHVVTIESRIGYRHTSQHSFISQRETGGDGEKSGAMLRAALREGPDVLVVDDLRGPEAVAVAMDAARAGRLVFATIAAASVDEARDRLLDVFVPARRPQVRALLSGILRGAIAQTLVKSVAGPLVSAREIWLSQHERRTSLDDSLLQLVRDGRVTPAEALRAAPDRELLAAALQEEGFEAGGERLAERDGHLRRTPQASQHD